MIVPAYWAEAREQARHNGRSLTVRRYGWSDESAAAAQAHAQARTREALDAILAGQALPRRERRTHYGVEGVPIREQIVSRHGDVVITRNSYGALCLNTPDVLFADIDLEQSPSGWVVPFALAAALAVAGFLAGLWLRHWALGLVLAGFALYAVNAWMRQRRRAAHGGEGAAEARAFAHVAAFSDAHPERHLRLYRTPAGLRVLVMDRCFDPQDAQAAALFAAMRADALYSVMCKVQHCFRARLTPKPWRIGIRRRIRPPVAAWSAEQATLPERLAWIAEYEASSAGFAACRFVGALGDTNGVDPKAEQVRALHDDIAKAHAELPLA